MAKALFAILRALSLSITDLAPEQAAQEAIWQPLVPSYMVELYRVALTLTHPLLLGLLLPGRLIVLLLHLIPKFLKAIRLWAKAPAIAILITPTPSKRQDLLAVCPSFRPISPNAIALCGRVPMARLPIANLCEMIEKALLLAVGIFTTGPLRWLSNPQSMTWQALASNRNPLSASLHLVRLLSQVSIISARATSNLPQSTLTLIPFILSSPLSCLALVAPPVVQEVVPQSPNRMQLHLSLVRLLPLLEYVIVNFVASRTDKYENSVSCTTPRTLTALPDPPCCNPDNIKR